jgi:SAM-dependent methyltransferase
MTLDERLSGAPCSAGVAYLSDPAPFADREERYRQVRKREGRLYDDAAVRALPEIDSAHPLAREWAARRDSFARLKTYLTWNARAPTILDLGCGNGWMSGRLAEIPGSRVYGLDLNQYELTQAARVFADCPRVTFAYADVLTVSLPEACVDVVILASAIQYFPNLNVLVRSLAPLLAERGEIHIMDSPLYRPDEVPGAQARTRAYYAALGFPEMAMKYHPHTFAALEEFRPRVMYDPRGIVSRLMRRFVPTSPFPWIILSYRDVRR